MKNYTNLPSSPKHHYRFAMIGSTSSGKTCLLGQMALARNYSKRFSATFIPINKKLTNDELARKERDPNLRQKYNFQVGEERLNTAQRDLQEYRLPAPTPNDTARPMVTFRLSDAEKRGDFFIWTEDYAGELLVVEGLGDKDSHSSRLKENLLHYDGLIVVVDAVNRPEQEVRLRKQIENLNQFLGALVNDEKEKRDCPIPVTVILSKWDRVSNPIDFTNPNQEQDKLEKYLSTHPVYKSIITSIQSKSKAIDEELEGTPLCDLTAGIEYGGNVAIFPTSAFGKATINENGEEVPDPTCPEAFCLVEPYYWLATRCDELQTKVFENQLESMGWFLPLGISALRSEIKTYRKRIRAATSCKKRLGKLLTKSWNNLFCFYLIWALIIGVAYDIGHCSWNWYQIANLESRINKRENSPEEIRLVREKLTCYKLAPYRGLLVGYFLSPSNQRVGNDVTLADNRVDELLWSPVVATEEPAKKAELAQQYLKVLPNGTHAAEAYKFVNEHDVTLENTLWNAVLKEENPEKRYHAVKNYLDKYGDHAIHYEEALKIMRDDVHQMSWHDSKIAYEKECQGENLSNIIVLLNNLISKYGTTPEYCGSYIEELPQMIDKKLGVKSMYGNAKRTIGECDKVLLALRNMETNLRQKTDGKSADIVLDGIRKTESVRQKSIDSHDKELYEKLRSSKTIANCDAYVNGLKEFGGGSMLFYVENYRTFLEKSQETRDVSLKMDLYWGPQTDIYKVRGTVKIDGITVYNGISKTWKNEEKSLSSGDWLKNVDPTKKHSVEIRFVSEDNWYGDECTFGYCKDNNVLLSDMNSGKQFVMEDKYGYGGKLKITVINVSSAPELPTWKEK